MECGDWVETPPLDLNGPPKDLSAACRYHGLMDTQLETAPRTSRGWVITEGKPVRLDPTEFDPEAEKGLVKEYRISEIGRYLLNPGPIEIRKRLIGCEAHQTSSLPSRLIQRVPGWGKTRRPKPDVLLSGFKLKLPSFRDPNLDAHFKKLVDELREFDPFAKKLARLDSRRLSHLVGICEDIGGGYSYLKLQGTKEEKIRYLSSHAGRPVRVTIHRAHASDGLFELRAFPATGFNPDHSFRLYAYSRDGQPAACVLTGHGNLDFRLPDPQALKYLSLIEHVLSSSPEFRRCFDACFAGGYRPVRLFFNRQLEVDYSKANLPEIYRNVLRSSETAPSSRHLVKPVLNYLQVAVSLSYLLSPDCADQRLFTHICILHDLRALEPLRKSLPAVYAEMSQRAFSSEAGRYYVLDSITGTTHAD
jgi:hypothetical protein